MNPLKLLVNGARGRMGQTVVACASAHPQFEVAGQVDLGDDLQVALPACQAVIDFTQADATADVGTGVRTSGQNFDYRNHWPGQRLSTEGRKFCADVSRSCLLLILALA